VSIVRGAGKCFSAGYDLDPAPKDAATQPSYHTAGGIGSFQREVTGGWMSIWDLAKPVIAQVHSYCLAGGSELATGCDLVYVADDAKIGYPAVRFGTPDMQYHAWLMGMRKGMEAMLTGDSMSGIEAEACGFATRSFPAGQLEESVLEIASRIAQIPSDIAQINKRTIHRATARMGLRSSIESGTELSAVAMQTETFNAFLESRRHGLTAALSQRDAPFGDYRTEESEPG
jgi:enoyl-CoA hydratase